jgi:hypothetical protein
MTWPTFFKSRSFKYGALFGTLSFGAGAGTSAALALKIASLCSSAVHSFITDIGTNITLSEMSAVVHFETYNVTIKLDDITTALPAGWLDVINSTTSLPRYCFAAPFTIGLCITAAASLALASAVALAINIHDQDDAFSKKRELLLN